MTKRILGWSLLAALLAVPTIALACGAGGGAGGCCSWCPFC